MTHLPSGGLVGGGNLPYIRRLWRTSVDRNARGPSVRGSEGVGAADTSLEGWELEGAIEKAI